MSLHLALVGCGQIARAHLDAIAALPAAALRWTVDADLERARAAAERFGTRRATCDYGEALADERLDAVVLCLPHHLHAPFAMQAAAAGKHVLVEKPMALDEGEAQQMVAAAERHGVQLSIGQSSRYIPTYWKAKEVLSARPIGRIVNVLHQRTFFIEQLSTDWRRAQGECGGLYLPLFGSHDIDALLWLLDETPARVWGSLRAASPVSAGESDGVIGLELSGGAIASLAFATRCRRARTETLFVGEEGYLLLRRNALQLDGEEVELGQTEEAFHRQMRLFVDALLTGGQVPAPGRQVLAVMRALDLVKRAHASGRAQVFAR